MKVHQCAPVLLIAARLRQAAQLDYCRGQRGVVEFVELRVEARHGLCCVMREISAGLLVSRHKLGKPTHAMVISRNRMGDKFQVRDNR